MLFPASWGMNQAAGQAEECAAKELLPQWGCSRYGPEPSASPTTPWDKSCSGNIWKLYPFGRRKKENRRQEGAYKVTTRDICMYVRWIRARVPICLPVCVSLHGRDFPLYKWTSFHGGSSADKQSCMRVALWRSRQFSSSSTSVYSDASFWFPFGQKVHMILFQTRDNVIGYGAVSGTYSFSIFSNCTMTILEEYSAF